MSSIRVVYDQNYNNSEYRMLQLNDAVLNDLKSGSSVYIKGENSGQCILSTSTKSYNIEKIDTSNTVLLCDKVDENSIVIKGISGSYLELINNPVDIRNILCHIPEFSTRSDANGEKIHVEELKRRCLYSEAEIRSVIKTTPYIFQDNDGYLYHVSSRTFHYDLVQFIQHCLTNSIALTSNSISSIIASSPPFPDFYCIHLLHCILQQDNINKRQLIYYLARSAYLCNDRISAFLFLIELTEWLSKEDLQNKISLWLPWGIDFDINEDEDCLKGVAIHETLGHIPGYRFVDRDVLALNPGDRLRQLFTIESEWTQEEIVPYIEDLESFGFGKPGDLLLKFCREVTFDNGSEVQKHYVLRH